MSNSTIALILIIMAIAVIIVLIIAVVIAIIWLLIAGKKEKKEKDAWKYLPPSEEIPAASAARTEPVEVAPEAKNTVRLWNNTAPAQNFYVVFEEVNTGVRYSARIENSILIGRADPADILIVTDSAVSRRHCQITKKGNRFILSDLGSGNGTKYNGNMVKDEVMISDGGMIEIGKSTYKVLIEPR